MCLIGDLWYVVVTLLSMLLAKLRATVFLEHAKYIGVNVES